MQQLQFNLGIVKIQSTKSTLNRTHQNKREFSRSRVALKGGGIYASKMEGSVLHKHVYISGIYKLMHKN
jgi:hypothetical protein